MARHAGDYGASQRIHVHSRYFQLNRIPTTTLEQGRMDGSQTCAATSRRAWPDRAPASPAARVYDTVRQAWRVVAPALAHRYWQGAAVVGGLFGSIVICVAGVGVSGIPTRPQPWWFQLPTAWTGSSHAQQAVVEVFYGGLALLTLSWFVVSIGVRAGRLRVRGVLLVAALWAIPLLVAPVALSSDLYTYLGQGIVAHSGLNPYEHGPAAAALPPVVAHRMSAAWKHTPTPYGPVFVAIVSALAPLARVHTLYAVVALPLVEVAGLSLLAYSLPCLACRLGADPTRAVWLGVASPIVLGSFVLSGHNDALMLGLVVSGLAVAARGGRIARVPAPAIGIALCALAGMVKAPPGAAVVMTSTVVWPWYLCWGLVLLAAAVPRKRVIGPIALAAVPLLFLRPDGLARQPVPVLTDCYAIACVVGVVYAAW